MQPLVSALRDSVRGIGLAVRFERSVRQEIVLLAVAVPAACILSESLWVRVALIGATLVVLISEFLNTAVEKLCDHVTPQRHPEVGAIKDFGSAAVFLSLALAALVWGAAGIERLAG